MNNLERCRSGKDFVSYARSRGADVRYGKGSHVVISTDRGACVVPLHKELGKGLRCKIIKTFSLIGLASFLLAILVTLTCV